MKRILIGDVHGCKEQLVALVDKINITKEDELIFLGDYTDRGPNSYGVFQYLKELKEILGDRLTILYGNHEIFAIEYAEKSKDLSLWQYNGGGETIRSFEENNCNLKEYAKFIKENAKYYYECEDFFAVHAGLLNEHPSVTLEDDVDALLWDRQMFTYGFYHEKLSFVGHTPLKQPGMIVYGMVKAFDYDIKYDLPETGLLGIDTGCFATNKLTAAIVEDKKVTFIHS